MGKATIGVVGGYWPENVFRYLAIPGWSLDQGVVERPAKQSGSQPALVAGSLVVPYDALAREVERVAIALQQQLAPGARVAAWVSSSPALLVAFLGAVKAGCAAALIDPQTPSRELQQQIATFGAELILCDEVTQGRAHELPDGPRLATVQDFPASRAKLKRARVDLAAPLLALSGRDGTLVWHSHHSLLAGAISFSTFTGVAAGQALFSHAGAAQWEGLYSTLGTLFKGGTCVFAEEGDLTLTALIEQHRPAYAVFSRTVPDRAAVYRRRSAASDSLAGVFVSVDGPFPRRWRRQMKSLLRSEVLTFYGRVEYGPIIASHPSWYEDPAVGIPVTNVDLWPLDPATSSPLDVSWEAIEYAEIGFRGPMIAPSARREGVEWLPTGLVATMDPNGFYYLLEQPTDWLRRIGLALPLVDY